MAKLHQVILGISYRTHQLAKCQVSGMLKNNKLIIFYLLIYFFIICLIEKLYNLNKHKGSQVSL